MRRPQVLLLALLALAAAPARAAWSWPDGQQRRASSSASVTGRRFADVPGRQRYEIVDPDSDDFTLPHPEDFAPGRPRPPPPNRPYAPDNNYPLINPNPGYRPPRPPGGPGGPLGGGLGGSPNRPPPGLDRYDPTDVSKCKCVHAFNCEGDGLQFGSCDVGKRYCCTKEPRGLGAGPGGPRPGGYGATAGGPLGGPGGPGGPGGYYGKPAILTGPSGPGGFGFGPGKVDRYDRFPGSSAYDRYPGGAGGFPGGSPGGILVGPRPTPYRPDPAAGFATRPGDFYNNYSGGFRGPSPYRDYDNYNRGYGARSATTSS
ncbi:hypothetical protein ONE63_010561 [Megalurothrips usitatus]|uniref:Uncharacterized protein n=1 Tax=Megalurothrips usitatus TaxID=439358 RepID=A0AAV7XF98_9NEOP|nr:hypothetical protein ONE63_010561 [Megalurothrips usitatus]